MLRLRNRQTFVAHKIVVLAGRIEDTSLLQRRRHEGLRSDVPILLLSAPEFKEREREKEASKKRERDQFKGNPADRNAEPGGDPDVPGVDEEGGHEDSIQISTRISRLVCRCGIPGLILPHLPKFR